MKYSNYWKQAGLPESSKLFSCKKEDLQGEEKYMQMVEKIFNWDFDKPSILSIFSAQNGVGKTHIAICLLKKYIYSKCEQLKELETESSRENYEAYEKKTHFENTFGSIKIKKEYDIYYEILATYKQSNNMQTEEQIINDYCNLDFLVIDDMFSTKENEFARRVILTIIDKRVDWLCKPTVITSNKLLKDINEIDSRIASRIDNDYLFQITSQTKDWRKEK